jgi:hypothetical protein
VGRYTRMRYIQTLNPETDYEEIFYLLTRFEFPWDYNQGFSFALVTDYVIPAISHTLASTGEFAHHGMKRFDDTMLFPFEAHGAGMENPHGRDTIRALNKLHAHYDISNDDYLHILVCHLTAAVDWINAYSWRRLTDNEIHAMVLTYRRLGELMGIKNIPATHADVVAWRDHDIAERGTWHYANTTIVATALKIIADLCPPGVKFLATRGILSLIDEPIRVLLGQPRMPAWLTVLTRLWLRARGRVVRWLPPRTRPYVRTPRSYPHGWMIEQFGPDPVRLNSHHRGHTLVHDPLNQR